jgi:hypothetical protein
VNPDEALARAADAGVHRLNEGAVREVENRALVRYEPA